LRTLVYNGSYINEVIEDLNRFGSACEVHGQLRIYVPGEKKESTDKPVTVGDFAEALSKRVTKD